MGERNYVHPFYMGVGRVWEHAVKDVASHGRMNGCMPLMPDTFLYYYSCN
jgi:hypothetical protein